LRRRTGSVSVASRSSVSFHVTCWSMIAIVPPVSVVPSPDVYGIN
jgi:hypothetical protein